MRLKSRMVSNSSFLFFRCWRSSVRRTTGVNLSISSILPSVQSRDSFSSTRSPSQPWHPSTPTCRCYCKRATQQQTVVTHLQTQLNSSLLIFVNSSTGNTNKHPKRSDSPRKLEHFHQHFNHFNEHFWSIVVFNLLRF